MTNFNFDVFISHSSRDNERMRRLAARLREDGLRVWYADWQPDELWSSEVEHGLVESRTLVLALSVNALASEWRALDRHMSLFRDPSSTGRRFIPLRLNGADIPDMLKQYACVEWTAENKEEYDLLLAACRPPARGAEAVPPKLRPDRQSRVFARHTAAAWGVAVSRENRWIVSSSADQTIRIWDRDSGAALLTLRGHTDFVRGVAIASDGRIVSASKDTTLRVWDGHSGECLRTLNGHTANVPGVAVTPDGRHAVSGSQDNTVRLWDIDSGQCVAVLTGHTGTVFGVTVTPDGGHIVSGSDDATLRIWDMESGRCRGLMRGHDNALNGVTVTPDGRHVVSASFDRTVRIWDLESRKCVAVLEGHTGAVWGVAVTPDSRRIVSGAEDGSVRVWDTRTGHCLAVLEGHSSVVREVAVTPDNRCIVSASKDGTVRIWDLPVDVVASPDLTRYANAKVLLVGDSGVGKTGLTMRLTEDRFMPTISSDGVWATQLRVSRGDGDDVEREVWLWDFAGQSDYRLIHRLYAADTALAVFVFNPQSENPFEGLAQWDRDLERSAAQSFRKLLVAARCDRGGLMVSRASIEQFCKERGFDGFVETSAVTGAGCAELKSLIVRHIPWAELPWTASPRIFKRLKEGMLELKDKGHDLMRIAELKQQLDLHLQGESFSLAELRTAVTLLANAGAVWRLDFGDFILLKPEIINGYAAALVRTVRQHIDEIGCISEEQLFAGNLDFQDLKRLENTEEQSVIRAMYEIFVSQRLCVREHSERGTLLVFPAYFKRERPELDGHPAVFITYQFQGALDEIYATLVVRLHYTPVFEKDRLWKFAADFNTQAGRRLGIKMNRRGEGAADLLVYLDPQIPDDTKVTFIRYVHDHLRAKTSAIVRLRSYVCPHCFTPVENRKTALERLSRGLKDIVCVNCEQRVLLWDLIEEKFASDDVHARVRELEQQSRKKIDNESLELILVGHAFAIAGEAGQIFRPTPNSDWGIDGEIEFKNARSQASGSRVYLQLKSGDSYLYTRKKDGKQIFKIKNERHTEYWQAQRYPVMLVIRTSDGQIRWMNVSEYLKRHPGETTVVFDGEPFTAANVAAMRDRICGFT